MIRRVTQLLAIISLLVSTVTTGLAWRLQFDRGPIKRALLIAIKGYKAPFPELEYPLNDVRRIEELLASPRYGFAGNIEKLTDDSDKDHQPTRDNILSSMRRILVADAVAGDTVVIYYSGHGSSIKNTLDGENDRRDETIVPIDAARPKLPADAFARLKPEERPAFFANAFHDIRDKELRELFHEAKKKGVMLTVILDSCHSGSATKGDEVSKEVDGVDVDLMLTPTAAQLAAKPEDDALVLAAAKDYQVATGGTHELRGQTALYSHFTAGLVEALYKTPADIVSADELFQEIVSGMQSQGRTMQTPVMIGAPMRTERTIFGTKPDGPAALLRTPGMAKDGSLFLTKAGIADGVAVGDEFKCILPEKNTVAVRVKSVDIAQSEVTTLPGTGDFASCNFFGQTRWSRAKLADLKVWMPPAMTAEQIKSAVASLKGMTLARADESPSPAIAFPEVVAGAIRWRKGATHAAAVVASDPLVKADERVFVNIPPTTGLRGELIKELDTAGGYRVVPTEDRTLAEYELIGVPDLSTGEVKYSWMLRAPVVENSALKASQKEPPLPPPTMPRITRAIGAADPGAAVDLANLARRLTKIRGLIRLTSPPAAAFSKFPYRLEVVESSAAAKPLKAGDVIDTGHAYDFRLTRVRDDVDLMTEFHVYLIDVDPNGASSVFYNMTFGSSVGDEDRKIDVLDPPAMINLVRLALSPDSPAGTDTILLLVTEKPIPKDRLSFPGVIDLNASKGEEDDPLKAILTDVGQAGSKGDTTPDNWSMQHLVLRTVIADKPSSLKDPVFPVDNKFP